MISSKQSINHLAYLCAKEGIRDVVFSPGSRNAPVIISFVESGLFNCYSVPDERVAAFMALGMSQHSKKATVICCTSGSAATNYTPAVTEAYYQGVPMFVLTADRPIEMIDQGIGQSIRQKDMFSNYIKYSCEFIQEASTKDTLAHNDKLTQKSLLEAKSDKPGPVHINLPFHEPLYDTNREFKPENIFHIENFEEKEDELLTDELKYIWRNSKRKLILYGMSHPNEEIDAQLQHICDKDNIVLLTETCSNIHIDKAIKTIDRVITTFKNSSEDIRPDLVVSLGGAVISKKIKKMLQDYKPVYHWWVGKGNAQNTFGALSAAIYSDTLSFLEDIQEMESINEESFQNNWLQRNEKLKSAHTYFCRDIPFSDLKVFEVLLKSIPSDSVLHMANSTPVRYVQLFDQRDDIMYLANRGVSGIDGSTSTALGYSMKSDKLNIFVTGDLSFFYDSNAFLHEYRPKHLRIVMINNSGGGIFRIIEGPSSTSQLTEFFEAKHEFNAKHLAQFYNLEYIKAENEEELNNILPGFLDPERQGISILEVFTNNELNPVILKSYFEFMNK